MVSEYKKHQMLVAGIMGLILGAFLTLALWFATKNIVTLLFIPVAGLIGVAQAFLSPEPEE